MSDFNFKEWFDKEVESLKDDPEYKRISKELDREIESTQTHEKD